MSEQNKKIAIAFYNKLINEFDAAGAWAQYGGETYTQHTPVIEDGPEGVAKFIYGSATTIRNRTWRLNGHSQTAT